MDATESKKVTLYLKKFTVPDAEVSFPELGMYEQVIQAVRGKELTL